MTSNKLADFLVLVLLLSSIQVLASNTNEGWKNFKNAYGWSVDYPADWKIDSQDSGHPPSSDNMVEIVEDEGSARSFTVDLLPGCNKDSQMTLHECMVKLSASHHKIISENETKIDHQEALQVVV
jgi:hypothetical protein